MKKSVQVDKKGFKSNVNSIREKLRDLENSNFFQ